MTNYIPIDNSSDERLRNLEVFNVCVRVLEAKHLAWPNMNSAVCVQIGNKKMFTNTADSSERPYYNEYFVFDYYTALKYLMNEIITLTVYQPRKGLKRSRRLGNVRLDVKTVWIQKDHQFYHKWFVVTEPTDNFRKIQGFLRCDISVIAPNVFLDSQKENEDCNESDKGKHLNTISSRKLSVSDFTVTRQHVARYIVKVYNAINLMRKEAYRLTKSYKAQNITDASVRVFFSGKIGQTTERKLTHSPEWNEQLVFIELFPPLFQAVRIDVCVAKMTLVSHWLWFDKISDNINNDHMQKVMYGPSYLHLYTESNLYCGSLLIAIETEPLSVLRHHGNIQNVVCEKIPTLIKDLYWQQEEFLCFCVIYESVVDTKIKTKDGIKFSISMGPEGIQQKKEADYNCITQGLGLKEIDKEYNFVLIGERKPCIFIRSTQPDFRNRMLISNVLENMAHSLKTNMKKADELVLRNAAEEADLLIRQALTEFKNRCYEGSLRKLLYTSAKFTKTDKIRCRKIYSKLDELISSNLTNMDAQERSEFCKKCYEIIMDLTNDPQDSLTPVIMYVWNGAELVGSCLIPTRKVLYSKHEKQRGSLCSKIHTVLVMNESKNNPVKCKIDVCLWVGAWHDVNYCLKNLPPQHEDLSEIVNLPPFLNYTHSKEFTFRCHIYNGQIYPWYEHDGLCSSYVKVLVSTHSVQTKVKTKTLNPMWMETLTISSVVLFTNSSFIKINPPLLLVELWNKEKVGELIGQILVKPYVLLRGDLEKCSFPSALEWFNFTRRKKVRAKILASFELIEKSNIEKLESDEYAKHITGTRGQIELPHCICPEAVTYRLEILFRSVLEFKRNWLNKTNRLKVTVDYGNVSIATEVSDNISGIFSFKQSPIVSELDLPLLEYYFPALVLRMTDNYGFGMRLYIGACIINNVHKLSCQFIKNSERKMFTEITEPVISKQKLIEGEENGDYILESLPLLQLSPTGKNNYDTDLLFDYITSIFITYLKKLWRSLNTIKFKNFRQTDKVEEVSSKSEVHSDWWMKYRHSIRKIDYIKSPKYKNKLLWLKTTKITGKPRDIAQLSIPPIVIYHNALEEQSEFDGFTDVFKTYEILGKNISKEKQSLYNNTVAKIKMRLCIYKWPQDEDYVTMEGVNPRDGILRSLHCNSDVQVLVRVYVIQAYNLHPSDPDGKADPFIEISTSNNTVSDARNYIPKQLNPVFGRCLELSAVFPVDSILTVKVMDWDRFTANDLIGETTIDIENRFYSRHRATCGLPSSYDMEGNNKWRDIQNPTDILAHLCDVYNLHAPIYLEKSVIVAKKEFKLMENCVRREVKERLALLVLNKWFEVPLVGCHLVPEHVETRSLYNMKFPGVEQGKLEMWVDLFDLRLGIPPAPINITPQKPNEYELRVIILNTADVELVDNSIFDGEKHSDIYVKGWISGPGDSQSTDVHYWSVTGEGNFNWRFIFHFVYFSAEERMLIRKKQLFAIDHGEEKVPAILHLQVWDNDRFSADDFIGSLSLELCRMFRGAKSKQKCKILKSMDPKHFVDLFKVKRVHGWWPFTAGYYKDTDQHRITGYVEADIQLLTTDEAVKYPAGLGRNAPDPLPQPNRPVHKFSLWMTPFRMLRFMVFKINKKKLVIWASVVGCLFFLCVAFYSLPVFIVKRIVGA